MSCKNDKKQRDRTTISNTFMHQIFFGKIKIISFGESCRINACAVHDYVTSCTSNILKFEFFRQTFGITVTCNLS